MLIRLTQGEISQKWQACARLVLSTYVRICAGEANLWFKAQIDGGDSPK